MYWIIVTYLKQIRIVVASPNDVIKEREALANSIIDRVNRNTAERLGLILKLGRWETDTYPGLHIDGPQGLVDSILKIEDCDILIGIFWKRFGTPTPDGKTGTEHEFYKAYDAWKKNKRPQVMLYFNQKEYSPNTTTEAKQHLAVLKFKEKLPKEAFYQNYHGIQKFRDMVYDHLTQYIQEKYGHPEPGNITAKDIKENTLVKPNVLWVDDNPGKNQDIIKTCRQQGVQFDLARTALGAYSCLKEKNYALIISDVERSKPLSGLYLIRGIKHRVVNPPPIIIFSSEREVKRYYEKAPGMHVEASFVTSSAKDLAAKISEIIKKPVAV